MNSSPQPIAGQSGFHNADYADSERIVLLEQARAALVVPFADPVCLDGVWVPRHLVRRIERAVQKARADSDDHASEVAQP